MTSVIRPSKSRFFAPQGQHVAPINAKVGTGEQTAGPLPRGKFSIALSGETTDRIKKS